MDCTPIVLGTQHERHQPPHGVTAARGETRRRFMARASTAAGSAGLSMLTSMLAAACATGTGSGRSDPAGGQPAAITFLSRDSGSEVEPYKQGVERFNASQSRVRVTHDLASGNFDQKLQTVVAAGTAPDASYMHSQAVPTYVALGVAGSLDSFARKDRATLDGLLPAAVDAYRFKSAVYGIADVATSYVMYINRALFTAAGVAVPAEKWTWADYLTAAQRISNAARGDQVFGTANYTAGDSWPSVLWQNGADILNKDRDAVSVDRPEAIEAFTWIADQIHKTRLHPSPADLGGKTGEQFFLDGKAAMLPTYSSRIGAIGKGAQFDVEVVHLPAGKQRVTRTACGGVAMYKGTKAPDGAWELLKFWAGEDFQWLMARVGGSIFPAHKKVANSPELFSSGQFARSPKVTVDAIAYARTEPYTVRYLEIKGALTKELDTIWRGEAAVKDALTRARAAMEPILADAVAK